MGIFCQINLFKPPDGAFQSGEGVSGMIKYALDEQTEFVKITVSLKGMGQLRIIERTNNKNRRNSYCKKEVYVDTDEIIQEGKFTIPVGSYETKFSFKLPQDIPPSFEYYDHISRYRVNCEIKYYVRIKFEKPGWFTFAKHFRKEITVASAIKPKLLMEPVIYGERKTLIQLFSSKTSTVIMKANITNSVIPIGGKIDLQYEIFNDTNVIVKSVETKLIEVHTFKATGHEEVNAYEDIPDSDSKTASIKCGETLTMPIEINVPSDKVSVDHSEMVSRNYVVRITAELPMPHRNVLLEIPVQIGDIVQRDECDPPPSYWEAMGEEEKDADSDEEALDNEKGEKS